MRRLGLGLIVVASLVALVPAHTARACGGFFRTETESATVTLDQSAVRLIFEIGADSVTAHVAVRYQGDASAFAWVIPVPAEPVEIQTSSVDMFEQLDQATAPQFVWISESGGDDGGGCSFGCGGATDKAGGGDFADDASGVTVWSQQNVGPYETAVLSSDDPQALTAWLVAGGFEVPAVAEPAIAAYVSSGSYFLAMKLNQAADASDVEPITFHYAGTEPCVPLRMDAISAPDDQPLLVWVFGTFPAEPANWAQTEPDWSHLENLDGETNYVELVTAAVDATGGQSWVTEYLDRTSNLGAGEENWGGFEITDPDLRALRDRNVYVTRFFTTVSPADMTLDPTFRFAADAQSVEHTHTWYSSADMVLRRRPGLPGGGDSLLALGLAVAGFWVGVRRRRRR